MAPRGINYEPLFNAGVSVNGVKKKFVLPVSAGAPAGAAAGWIWQDSSNGNQITYHDGTSAVVLSSGLTTEQLQDIIGPFLADTADLDFTYDDAGNAVSAIIKVNSVTYAKIQQVSATARVLGRKTAGAGNIEELTGADLKTIIGAIANGDLATMPTLTIKGNNTGGTAAVLDLTAAQTKALLAIVAADVGFAATARILGRKTAGAGAGEEMTAADVRTFLGTLDADTLNGLSAATLQTNVINSIVAGAGTAWDTLLEIKAFIQADESTASALATTVAGKARFKAAAVPSGATPQAVTHSMALTNMDDYMVVIRDASHNIVEYGIVTVDANSFNVIDDSGTAIPAGLRYFMTCST